MRLQCAVPPIASTTVEHRRYGLNAVDWAVHASFAAGTLGAWGLQLEHSRHAAIHTARRAARGTLLAGIFVLGVWTGAEVGRRQRSTWLGLASSAVLFFASGLLTWLGLGPWALTWHVGSPYSHC